MSYILVTGGSGYVGSHVAKMLYEHGYSPVVFDLQAQQRPWASPHWPAISGDINNKWQLERLFESFKFDAVIHLAASSEVGSSVWNPLEYYRNNVGGTAAVLTACNKYGIEKFVFSSTSSVYGEIDPKDLPTKESHPKNPATSYGASKMAVELMLRDVQVAHRIRSVSLRYFNASGAAPDGSIGEWRKEPTHLIPSIQAYLEGRREYFTVFGTDYNTRDGSTVRDYAHVWDIARAHVDALHYLDRGGESVALNIGAGSNRGISVLEIVDEFERQLGRKLDVRYAGRRAGDIPINYADISQAKNVIGWEPKISNAFNIVKDALNWYNSDLYKGLVNGNLSSPVANFATN